MFDAGVLLGFFEAALDWPATGVAAGDVGAAGGQVGGDEEVVGFRTCGVADHDQADQGVFAHCVAGHVEDGDEAPGVAAAHVDGDLGPGRVRCRGGQLGWLAQPAAFEGRPTAFAGAWRRRFIQRGVPGASAR